MEFVGWANGRVQGRIQEVAKLEERNPCIIGMKVFLFDGGYVFKGL